MQEQIERPSAIGAEILNSLNDQFLSNHHEAAQYKLRKKVKYVFINLCGKLTLWANRDNEFVQTQEAVIPSPTGLYTRAKQISHFPLLLMELMKQYKVGAMTAEVFSQKVRVISEEITTVIAYLETLFSAEHVEIQRKILLESKVFCQSILDKNGLFNSKQHMQVLLEKINPFLQKNIAIGGHAIIEELHQVIDSWKISKEQLRYSRAIVVGPHGPREGEPISQYFIKKFSTELGVVNPKDDFFYYMETMPQLMGKLDAREDIIHGFLATAEWNKRIGKTVLSDSRALFKDILAGPAEEVVNERFKEKRCPIAKFMP